MRITTEMLQEYEACEEDLELFEKLFPEGAEVTEENAALALEAELSLTWVMRWLPPLAAWSEWERASNLAWQKCKRACISAEQEYHRGADPFAERYEEVAAPAREELWKRYAAARRAGDREAARRAYWRATAKAQEAFERGIAPFSDEYHQVVDRAEKEHNNALSVAFVRLWRKYMS